MTLILKLNTFETLMSFHNKKVKENCLAIDTYQKAYAVNNDYNSLLKDLYQGNITEENFNIDVENHIITNNSLSVVQTLKACFTEETPIAFYYYPESKTVFRKNVFSEVPESLYKKYYKLQKKYGFIEKATGSYVILNEMRENDSETILSNDLSELETSYSSGDFSKFIEIVQEMQEDIEYYRNYISTFQAIVNDLENQNTTIQQQLHNKQISTWY